jgi:hypothetical protein
MEKKVVPDVKAHPDEPSFNVVHLLLRRAKLKSVNSMVVLLPALKPLKVGKE